MKDLLKWIDSRGGPCEVLCEIGVGLFFVIVLAKCAMS